jgi:aconitate hydratase
LERYAKPGKTLLGADSHTPTGGGIGMLAIGAGGLDVAMAMAGQPFYLTMPKIVNVILKGKLQPWVSAKDIILELLRRLTVKGGVGKIFEYSGEGVSSLTIPERATITNMGAELGATSSLFPSDEQTRKFLKAQGRIEDFVELKADVDAEYDECIVINLDELVPLVALPHSPDNVVEVAEIQGLKIDQVFIGSCTNSSFADLAKVASILKGKIIHPDVSLCIAPGSRQVFQMLAEKRILADLIASGARILESACGPCVGIGQAPPSNGVSLRTSNRNFEGRSGTADARIYLASAETCALSALNGYLTDPRTVNKPLEVYSPERFTIDDRMIIVPPEDGKNVEIIRGPNIRPLPEFKALGDSITSSVVLKVGDNITTDHIMPAGAKILPLRSNIPEIAKYVFAQIDSSFYERVINKGGIIVGGHNYGQGSSREHAALAPKYLGIKAVIVKSFARIHRQNLINFGIIPFTFVNEEDYERIKPDDQLSIDGLKESLLNDNVIVRNISQNIDVPVKHSMTSRQIQIIMAGGLLKYISQEE